jgi:hypothetical protein
MQKGTDVSEEHAASMFRVEGCLFYPEDSGSRLVRSVIIFLPDYIKPHHELRP